MQLQRVVSPEDFVGDDKRDPELNRVATTAAAPSCEDGKGKERVGAPSQPLDTECGLKEDDEEKPQEPEMSVAVSFGLLVVVTVVSLVRIIVSSTDVVTMRRR